MPNKSRNPSWVRDELILALDLYFRLRPLKASHNHPDIVSLSDLLKNLPIHLDPVDKKSFRNPNSVFMKLCNFLPLDPTYKGKGLSRGGTEDVAVWNQFAGDPKHLAATAAAIRTSFSPKAVAPHSHIDSYEDDFAEGRLLFRSHVTRERNRMVVSQAKQRALRRHGKLFCEVCGFDFKVKYGVLGENYIECHHTLPVSQLAPGAKTRIRDIVLVCSNCHRMLHRRRPWLAISDLRLILTGNPV